MAYPQVQSPEKILVGNFYLPGREQMTDESKKILKEVRKVKLFVALGFILITMTMTYHFVKIVNDRESESLNGAIELFKHTTDNFYKKPPEDLKKKKPLPERI